MASREVVTAETADTEAQTRNAQTEQLQQVARQPEKIKELIPMSNFKYDIFLWSLSILVDLFFREVHPRGSWRVPRTGPILFVAAPHANQVRSSLHLHPGCGSQVSAVLSRVAGFTQCFTSRE